MIAKLAGEKRKQCGKKVCKPLKGDSEGLLQMS